MRILITGNMGYVGPQLIKHLRQCFPDATLIGFDNGYFGHCLTRPGGLPERLLSAQYFGDIRRFPFDLLDGMDVVVHLSAVSNDPMGSRFEDVTDHINYRAGIDLADEAKRRGVSRFIFASSCSMYGAASGAAKKETDSLNPLTAYARSKVATERGLAEMGLGGMAVTCLRFATACGMSDRLRLDLVLNDFVACALSTGEISVLSDGTPWRPLIDVKDMARAIEWAIVRNVADGGQMLCVNAGSDAWNYQVSDLAEAVASAIPGTRVSINREAPPDKRSYRVDFSTFAGLAPDHQPVMTLERTIDELHRGLKQIGFADPNFRNSHHIRLKVLEGHIRDGRLDDELWWRVAA